MKFEILFYVLVGFCVLSVQGNNSQKAPVDAMLLQELLRNYDSRVGPFEFTGEPTVVKMSIYVQEMSHFNDLDMEFTMVLFFRRSWKDPRLAFSNLTSAKSTLYIRDLTDIWWPDVYFVNERDSKLHVTTLPNSSTRIEADGTVLVSSRYSVTLSCPMDLRKFPLDTQSCKLEMESYTYPLSLVTFEWLADIGLELPQDLQLTQFTLQSHKLQYCTGQYSIGGYACLRVIFMFERKYTYHILNSYIPSAFIVVVSWISFWISPDAVPGRVTLGVTTVLTMTTQTFISGLSLPHVPYVKALDVWMTVCMLFVFGALLEYAIVNWSQRKSQKADSKENEITLFQLRFQRDNSLQESEVAEITQIIKTKNLHGLNTVKSDRIDEISQKLFPVMFLSFAGAYWVFYHNWTPISTATKTSHMN